MFVHETGTMRGGSHALRYARVARDARNWPYRTLLRTNHHRRGRESPGNGKSAVREQAPPPQGGHGGQGQ